MRVYKIENYDWLCVGTLSDAINCFISELDSDESITDEEFDRAVADTKGFNEVDDFSVKVGDWTLHSDIMDEDEFDNLPEFCGW